MPQEAILLEDFGLLQDRYQALALTARAAAVLSDASPALEAADEILASLAEHGSLKPAFDKLRKNSLLTGKMRPSEAKTLLMDGSDDFIRGTRHKLAAWRKTMERVQSGEDVVKNATRDTIPASAPLALAVIGSGGISHYLSVIQLVFAELAKLDAANAALYLSHVARVRRCATVLSDYENAAAIQGFIQ